MRETLENKNFNRDDARVALMEYGHDRSGHDRPVEEIVQIWADDPRPPLVQLKHVSGLCMVYVMPLRTHSRDLFRVVCQPRGGHPLLVRKSSVSYPSVYCVNAWYGARSAA